jgi:Aromatic amino acid lyase
MVIEQIRGRQAFFRCLSSNIENCSVTGTFAHCAARGYRQYYGSRVRAKGVLVASQRIFRNGEPIVLDGQSLTVAGVVGVARYGASVALSDAPDIRERIVRSRSVLIGKIEANKSVYGLSTGFGGSGARHLPATPHST